MFFRALRVLQDWFGNRLSMLALFSSLSCHSNAFAECTNTAAPTCDVYSSCFAKYCDCKGSDDEYFETYGAKYCTAFLGVATFSEAGRMWRDSTLRCLQESIVPHLSLDNPSACNCKVMKEFAYKSHVACYTLPTNSMCDLPLEDIYKVYTVVSTKDALSSAGWKQMHAVTEVCSKLSSDDGRRSLWKIINSILSVR